MKDDLEVNDVLRQLAELSGFGNLSEEMAHHEYMDSPSHSFPDSILLDAIKFATKNEVVSDSKIALMNSRSRKYEWTNDSVLLFAQEGDPIQTMEHVAKRIVLKASSAGWGARPPFDPIELAGFLDPPIAVEPNHDIADARVLRDGRRFKIEYNPNNSLRRIRYSIAHEIAHTFFPDCGDRIRNRENKRELAKGDLWQLEMLCNIGASEILMPQGSVNTEDLKQSALTMDRVIKIREEFQVSTEAALSRLVRLVNHPCLMFVASPDENSVPLSYKIDYSRGSRNWTHGSINGFAIPAESIVSRCFATGYSPAMQLEEWPCLDFKLNVQAMGLVPYDGQSFPRVAGIIEKPKEKPTNRTEIEIVLGDALKPQFDGRTIIAFIVNDKAQRWGGGFAKAVKTKWPVVQDDFASWWFENPQNKTLGNSRLCRINDDLFSFSMIAQHDWRPTVRNKIRYDALNACLAELSKYALALNASVQMPRIGCNHGEGRWPIVRELIDEHLISNCINTTVLVRQEDLRPAQLDLFE